MPSTLSLIRVATLVGLFFARTWCVAGQAQQSHETGSSRGALAETSRPESERTDSNVEALALEWFEHMAAGRIDRAQLAAEYSDQLTDEAVQGMSSYLKEHRYGASPTGAQVLKTRTIGNQTFYVVKLVFPRGDAASLMLGLNAEGKITGISLMSLAGD